MNKLNISILGCGWLGLPLLKSLVAAGHNVKGSSRKQETRAEIKTAGGEPFEIDLPQEIPAAFLDDCHLLIWTLPPRGRALGEAAFSHYSNCLFSLNSWVNNPWKSNHVMFMSSTGVFGDAKGVVSENTPFAANTISARILSSSIYWLRNSYARTDVLHLAGLIGPGRHPGRFYGGRDRLIPNADAPVNLVHQDDVIAAVKLIMEENDADTYNICAAAHPAKGDFYTAAAKSLGLEIAGVIPGGAGGKVIDSSKLRALGWQPKWDDILLTSL